MLITEIKDTNDCIYTCLVILCWGSGWEGLLRVYVFVCFYLLFLFLFVFCLYLFVLFWLGFGGGGGVGGALVLGLCLVWLGFVARTFSFPLDLVGVYGVPFGSPVHTCPVPLPIAKAVSEVL